MHQKSMMNEEQYIKSRMDGRNPFQVPEGYFDRLTAEVMQKLPEQPKRSLTTRLRPWMYAAACVVAVLFTATVYFFTPDRQQTTTIASTMNTDSYLDDVADYVMADNIAIYACLTEN